MDCAPLVLAGRFREPELIKAEILASKLALPSIAVIAAGEG